MRRFIVTLSVSRHQTSPFIGIRLLYEIVEMSRYLLLILLHVFQVVSLIISLAAAVSTDNSEATALLKRIVNVSFVSPLTPHFSSLPIILPPLPLSPSPSLSSPSPLSLSPLPLTSPSHPSLLPLTSPSYISLYPSTPHCPLPITPPSHLSLPPSLFFSHSPLPPPLSLHCPHNCLPFPFTLPPSLYYPSLLSPSLSFNSFPYRHSQRPYYSINQIRSMALDQLCAHYSFRL